ncbi:SDR family oxidoreductase [Suttonella ornithocola]|uniref:NADP-dependent 3-hydroxy acid dehydrogenase YdfG n=1 Tax=Suttonella ornithocola TaxID=279832 RepID=A0A380MWP7_9GAMM|nr:SDR family oxidoreductase [Suttonella ornithocola]SUO95837.1 NADP-dependent 3-hydroxy acid dehydrogenase YdfG [Suttonella ornithocola]
MIVFITGASAGFGAALAKQMVEKGHKVIGTARRVEKLAALQKQLGENFFPLPFDICDIDAGSTAIDSLPKAWQEIDVLVNNAGLALGVGPAYESHLEDWLKMIDTNIRGLVAITHKILPGMVARNRGHIINLSSIAGSHPYPGGNVYGGTKAFVTQFSRNLRADLFGKNIRVTNIEPGVIGGTEFSNVRYYGDDQAAAKVYDGFENMTGEDVANIILWCAELPAHININRLEVMPTAQTFAGLTVAKKV